MVGGHARHVLGVEVIVAAAHGELEGVRVAGDFHIRSGVTAQLEVGLRVAFADLHGVVAVAAANTDVHGRAVDVDRRPPLLREHGTEAAGQNVEDHLVRATAGTRDVQLARVGGREFGAAAGRALVTVEAQLVADGADDRIVARAQRHVERVGRAVVVGRG